MLRRGPGGGDEGEGGSTALSLPSSSPEEDSEARSLEFEKYLEEIVNKLPDPLEVSVWKYLCHGTSNEN